MEETKCGFKVGEFRDWAYKFLKDGDTLTFKELKIAPYPIFSVIRNRLDNGKTVSWTFIPTPVKDEKEKNK